MRDPSRWLRKESGKASRVCPGACWGPWPGRVCPSWPHKAPLSSRCSPASWGMLSSHCGPGECHLMVRARLTSWSPCALPSQCPRPQISQLPGTSCKKEREAAGEDRAPHGPRWAWSRRRGFLQPTPLGLAHPGLPQGVQAVHTAHLATSPLTPLPELPLPGRQQLTGKGLPFCQVCPYPPTPIPELPALPTALTHSAITQLIAGHPFLSHTQDWKTTTTLEETAPSSSNS